MMRAGCFSLFFLCALYSPAQSPFKQFRKLSPPEKCWVLKHPFTAMPAFKITRQVEKAVDSLKRINVIGTDINGGKLDAFKHACWMASLTVRIGCRRSLQLGEAHEKGNRLQFEKHLPEDSILPDSVSSVMDLRNNSAGALLVKRKERITAREIHFRVLTAVSEGKLWSIKKDASGNFLTCDGQQLLIQEWKGKWNIPKCLIPSDQQ